jgi:hypothetical protein
MRKESKDDKKEQLLINENTSNRVEDTSKSSTEEEKVINSYGYTEDAYLNSFFLSKLFFYWAFRIMKLANRMPLKLEFLGSIQGQNRAELYLDELNYFWETKDYKNKSKNPLLKTILRANGCIIIS